MKSRYFIFLKFKGTRYHGWQLQNNAETVQNIVEESLSVILQEKISITGAGRTDAGVHASYFCAHFDSISDKADNDRSLVLRLNKYMPSDISIVSVRKVKNDANARFSALSRTYRYYISTEKDPFLFDSSWLLNVPPDIEIMNKAAAVLKDYSDFTSFSRLHSDVKTNICRIYEAEWSSDKHLIIFTIKADRFLRNMVRAIVGTMVKAGFGKISVPGFKEIIELKDRGKAGPSAPAKGLFLENIEYPGEIFI